MSLHRIRRICFVAAAGALAAGPLAAQVDALPGAAEPPRAAPALPSDHWARNALWRLDAMGLVSEHFGAARSLSTAAVAAALAEAVPRAEERGDSFAPIVRGWAERFAREHRALRRREEQRVGWSWEGRVEAGVAAPSATSVRTEPAGGLGTLLAPPAGPDGLVAAASVALYPHPRFAASATPVADAEGVRFAAVDFVAAAGALELAIGRGTVRYGAGEGVLMSGQVPLDRLQLQSRRPLRLPGRLRSAGPFGLHLFVASLDEARHPGDPWLWGGGGEWQPHPRLNLALHRAAIFGGRDSPVPLTPRSVVRMLVGVTSDGFDNQIVTGSVFYRLPTERALPIALYGEWGADDTAGAMIDSPGLLLGALLPALPGAPSAGAGAEFAFFGNRCDRCAAVRDPHYWYRHFVYRGGWASGAHPLGHPLGGNGTELRAYLMPEIAGAVSARADVFVRRRDAENLYGPLWAGASQGVRLRASWGPRARVGAQAYWEYESGEQWSANQLRVLASVFF